MKSIDDIVRYFDSIDMKQSTARLLAAGRKTPEAMPAPPDETRRRTDVSSSSCAGSLVWRLAPAGGETPNLRILYLHGGAYYHPAVLAHWKLMTRLVEQLGAEVIAPDYPLVPEYTYRDTYAMLEPLYRQTCQAPPANRFVIMGDSAGGGLALALCQYALETGLPQPETAVLLSPWLDVTMTDPAIKELNRIDPFLEPISGREIGRLYAGGDDPRQYRISPLYGPLTGLPPLAVFTGTRDILNADARALARRMESEPGSGPLHLFEYPGMIHTWMLFPIPQAVAALEQVKQLLQR